MDKSRIEYLISQGSNIYNSCCDTIKPLEKWKDQFEGKEEYPIANLFYDYICKKNQRPSTRIWSITNLLEKEILKEISSNICNR